jgi:multidrug resistance efflux pump
MILEDQIKQAQEELAEAHARLKQVRPPTAQMKRDLHRIKVMENKVEISVNRYNQIQSTNRSYRAEIDVMRKEQRNLLRVNKSLIRDIEEIALESRKANTLG